MQVKVIPADDTAPVRTVAARSQDINELVGGYVMSHPVPERQDVIALLNEDGKRLGLPLNRRATELLAARMFAGDYVVGDVVLAGFDQIAGRLVSCPPNVDPELVLA